MTRRGIIATAVALVAMAAAVATTQAATGRQCGSEKVGGLNNLEVAVQGGHVRCGEARNVMWSFYAEYDRHRHVCYRNTPTECRNGHPTDRVNTVTLVGRWRSVSGAGGGGCRRGRDYIEGTFSEESGEG